MTGPQPNGGPPQPPAPPPPAPPMGGTPNAEKYVLEADAMRRRQLRSALLHGSRRTWREHPRVWPAIVVGVIAVAVVLAAIAVVSAYQKQMDKQEEQEEESNALVWAQRDRVVDTGYVVRGADSAHVRLEIHVTAHSDESEGRH